MAKDRKKNLEKNSNGIGKGAFINDVTQVGGREDPYICDIRYKLVSKIAILV